MSRRDRLRAQREASIRDRPRRPRDDSRRREGWTAEPPDPAAQLDRLTLALLPLRAFLGVTFVDAGIDKLTTRTSSRRPGWDRSAPSSTSSSRSRHRAAGPAVRPTVPGRRRAADRHRRDRVLPLPSSGSLFRLSAAGPSALSICSAHRVVGDQAVRRRARPAVCARLATLARAGTGGRYTIEAWLTASSTAGWMMSRLIRAPTRPQGRLPWCRGARGDRPRRHGPGVRARAQGPSRAPVPRATPGRPSRLDGALDGGGSPAATAAPGAAATPAPALARYRKGEPAGVGRAVTFDYPITGLILAPSSSCVTGSSWWCTDMVCTHAGCTVSNTTAGPAT